MKNITYINAGAGSGKTYTLTKTLTNLIKEKKVKPEQVILTTFTTKAANEFKEKAKTFLFEAGMYDEALRLDHAMIGTVHSVCQRMIGKYWFNLGLSPNMGVMAEEDTTYYISQSLAELPTDDELKILHEFARNFSVYITDRNIVRGFDYDFWQQHLKSIIGFATNYEIDDFALSEEKSLEFIRKIAYSGRSIVISDDEINAMLQEAHAYVDNNNKIKKKAEYHEKIDEVRRSSYNKNIAWHLLVMKNLAAKYGEVCEEVLGRVSDIWTSKEVYEEQERYIKLMFDLAKRWKDNFVQFKREKNLLDYNDMEKYMRMLMEDKSIAGEISKSYRYLFVDEFQDSSPIQVKIFDSLSDLMEHSYWVGDFKQAIYGFRGSDSALTKAVVDRISEKKNGCDTYSLDTSWRSLPDIVELNNDVFTKTFSKVLTYEQIHLKQHRTNDNDEVSLRYFQTDRETLSVAAHVAKLINEGAKPNEIAVLARYQLSLDYVAAELKQYNVPTSREEMSVDGSLSCNLVVALLRIVNSSVDNLAKATVAMLVDEAFSTKKLIEGKLLNDADSSARAEDFLMDVPLIKQLLAIKPKLLQQSVAAMIESMIIELNLFNVVKKVEADDAFGISCLQTIITTAKAYEDHCVQMNMPDTIEGFIAYLEEVKPKGKGDVNGVQLQTYHSCKGLQWKYVILMSLNTDETDKRRSVKHNIFGVHFVHVDEPSAKNPYPVAFVRLMPWLYGSYTMSKVPQEIEDKIEESTEFDTANKAMLAETNRLLYVGMTRACDVLLLEIEPPKKGAEVLKWFKCGEGMDNVAPTPPLEKWDALGVGRLFTDYTLKPEEVEALAPFDNFDETRGMEPVIDAPSYQQLPPRYVSPSGIHKKGDVVSYHSFKKRISFGKQPSEMTIVGDCIHQIFAGVEDVSSSQKISLDEIVSSYGLSDVLINSEEILSAWRNLTDYLSEVHGVPVATYHERPFRLERDGQSIVGSIDLVWKVAEGDILVDFKTCPMGVKDILNPECEHYAGWYAGQLDAYTDALQAAGENVIKRYIYYPVSGLLAEVGR